MTEFVLRIHDTSGLQHMLYCAGQRSCCYGNRSCQQGPVQDGPGAHGQLCLCAVPVPDIRLSAGLLWDLGGTIQVRKARHLNLHMCSMLPACHPCKLQYDSRLSVCSHLSFVQLVHNVI